MTPEQVASAKDALDRIDEINKALVSLSKLSETKLEMLGEAVVSAIGRHVLLSQGGSALGGQITTMLTADLLYERQHIRETYKPLIDFPPLPDAISRA